MSEFIDEPDTIRNEAMDDGLLVTDNRTTELLPCPFCGSNKAFPNIELGKHWVECSECAAESGCYRTEAEAIAAWNTRAHGTLTAEQVRECVQHVYSEGYNDGSVHRSHGIEETDWQAIANELNAELGIGSTKKLMLKAFGLAQMMYDCWLGECKAGDNVDVSACNAYSYELDQIAQAMFDMGIDPNDSDYYRSAELGSGTCEIDYFDDGLDEAIDGEIISYAPPTWYLTCGHTVQGMEAPSFCQECGKRVIEAVER